ncbi:MAG TPA: carboxypeptidase-like regulatory domain-containing protein [Rubrobacter sp.]|nr:carboxypeptidase-like regulatory domain-containing protein [Rubrobacter sp.]
MSFSRLVDWVEGRLPEDEARAVEEEVARADSSTLADVAWLRKFFNATDNAVLESPPKEVGDSLVARFEAHAKNQRTPGVLKRVLAGLAFDSDIQPALGLRAVGAQRSRRQLIYSADEFDVALNLLPRESGKNLDLDGQVLPREDEELELFSVQLLQNETEFALTVTDELGGFGFRLLPPGTYELVLSTDRVEISIAPVTLST